MIMQFDIPRNERSIIKVLGVGGGGGNALKHMADLGIQGVDFAICNTDAQAMDTHPVSTKIQLGPTLTEGRGAGSLPEKGKEACIESIDEVRKFLSDGTKMLFVTAGLGGGTGTGAAPIIAKAAKEMDILTVAICTLPFKFEGTRRKRQALEGLEQLKKSVDAIIVISNEKLKQIYGNLSLTEAFQKADNILTTAAKGIAEIITVPGHVNVDFEDVNTVMRDSGVAIMGNAIMEGEDRARKAIHEALNSPLLEENDIRGAKHILLNITSGTSEVTMDEITEITEYVQDEAGYGTDIIWGNCKDETLGEKLSITLIATGFDEGGRKRENSAPEKEVRVTLEDEIQHVEEAEPTTSLEHEVIDLGSGESTTIEFDTDDVKKTIETFRGGNIYAEIREEEDKQRMEERRKLDELESARREFLRQNNSKPLDNPRIISDMENVPAYKRRKVSLEEDSDDVGNRFSNYSISDDLDKPLNNSQNSYLHDNVD